MKYLETFTPPANGRIDVVFWEQIAPTSYACRHGYVLESDVIGEATLASVRAAGGFDGLWAVGEPAP